MFVNEAFRGQGIAKRLLDIVIKWAFDHEIEDIYLGTMTQFIAAQKFYEKHGFMKILKSDLPRNFSINPVDAAFYKRNLS
jgi:ribosomal protein S18 acetylase RimI-like enzyme